MSYLRHARGEEVGCVRVGSQSQRCATFCWRKETFVIYFSLQKQQNIKLARQCVCVCVVRTLEGGCSKLVRGVSTNRSAAVWGCSTPSAHGLPVSSLWLEKEEQWREDHEGEDRVGEERDLHWGNLADTSRFIQSDLRQRKMRKSRRVDSLWGGRRMRSNNYDFSETRYKKLHVIVCIMLNKALVMCCMTLDNR